MTESVAYRVVCVLPKEDVSTVNGSALLPKVNTLRLKESLVQWRKGLWSARMCIGDHRCASMRVSVSVDR